MRRDFQSFEAFATAPLADIYSEEALRRAFQVSVNELRSCTLLNDGSGSFTFSPLPALAQVAPGFGVVVVHVNADPYPDLCLVQNFYTPQRETGRMAGGVGAVLLGDGAGGFDMVPPRESGFVMPGDGKSGATVVAQDGTQHVLVAQNNDRMASFTITSSAGPVLAIRLRGPEGNPWGIGARVSILSERGVLAGSEIYAGNGYLSQSSPLAVFGVAQARPTTAQVHWPDGTISHHPLAEDVGPTLELQHPSH